MSETSTFWAFEDSALSRVPRWRGTSSTTSVSSAEESRD